MAPEDTGRCFDGTTTMLSTGGFRMVHGYPWAIRHGDNLLAFRPTMKSRLCTLRSVACTGHRQIPFPLAVVGEGFGV
jgi:hypothetical protein